LCPVLAQRLHENGEHQYLVQLGDAVYPAWYFADGLSAELKSKRTEFDAWCDAEMAAGRKLPRPSKTPVPSFAWEKPCLEQVPDSESEDDKDDGDSLDSDDSEFEPQTRNEATRSQHHPRSDRPSAPTTTIPTAAATAVAVAATSAAAAIKQARRSPRAGRRNSSSPRVAGAREVAAAATMPAKHK
jgi:hypothetical protein